MNKTPESKMWDIIVDMISALESEFNARKQACEGRLDGWFFEYYLPAIASLAEVIAKINS